MEKQEKIIELYSKTFFLKKKSNKFDCCFEQIFPFYFKKKSYNFIYNLNFYFKLRLKKKKYKKYKKVCIILFKRRDYFTVMHIYVNNKIVFLANYGGIVLKKRKFYKFFKNLFKSIKKTVFSGIKFKEIKFIFQIKKKRRKIRRKINRFKKKPVKFKRKRTKTVLSKIFIKKVMIYFLFFIFSKKTRVTFKYLYNSSHAYANEKTKKKRRK